MFTKIHQMLAARRRRLALVKIRQEFERCGYPLDGLADSQIEAALPPGTCEAPPDYLGPKTISRALRRLSVGIHMPVRAEEASGGAGLSNFTSNEFLAMVTHELRTPLTCILGWIRMLREGKLDATSSDCALKSIERSAESLELLIDDLLDVSRITSGKFRIDARGIDLAAIITDTIGVVDIAARAKGIRIDTDYGGVPSFVMGDPERLRQVIWNLLTNAIKFTPEG